MVGGGIYFAGGIVAAIRCLGGQEGDKKQHLCGVGGVKKKRRARTRVGNDGLRTCLDLPRQH